MRGDSLSDLHKAGKHGQRSMFWIFESARLMEMGLQRSWVSE